MATLKDRNTLTLKNFRGIDYASSPFSAASFRAVESRNMELENGVLQKRTGWRLIRDFQNYEVGNGGTYINGMEWFSHWVTEENQTVAGFQGFLVHMGKRLYAFDQGNEANAEVYDGEVEDEYSTFVKYGDRVYILCGEIVVFGYFPKDGVSAYRFVRLTELDDLYIPTTTVGIAPEGEAADSIQVREAVSLLTPWRKNELEIPPVGAGTWKLDSAIVENSDLVIEVESPFLGTTLRYVNRVSNDTEHYPRTGKVYLYHEGDRGDVAPSGSLTWGGVDGAGNLTPASLEMRGLYHTAGVAVVTFQSATYRPENAKRITECRVASVFGVNGNTDRLFLSGNPNAPGRIFYSGARHFDYFGDNGYVTAGKPSGSVTAFLRLSDNHMAVLKNADTDDFSLFFLAGSTETQSDGFEKTVFYVQNGGAGYPCLNGRSVANLNGDAVMLTEEGLVGIVTPSDSVTGERYIKERSYSIHAPGIPNLRSGHGIAYRGRYYLAVNDEEQSCFVADPKYRYYRDGNDVDQSYNYEWFHWNHIPAKVWYVLHAILRDDAVIVDAAEGVASVDSVLLFGTADGKIYAFGTDLTVEGKDGSRIYSDRDCERIPSGNFTVRPSDNRVIFNERWLGKIQEGDRLLLDGWPLHASEAYRIVDLEGNTFRLKIDRTDGEILDLSRYRDLYAYVTHLEKAIPVRAEWVTPYLDLGSNLYAKTLLGLSLTAGAESKGVRFGYQTKRRNGMTDSAISSFDEGSFSVDGFSMENGFPASHTVRTNVRNFNYIRFRLVSDNDSPCSFHALSTLYKINRMNRGVR